jgi:hypothetical protein
MIDENRYYLCVTHSPLVTRVFEAAMRQLGVANHDICYIARRGVACPGSGFCLDEISDEMERCFRKFDRDGYAAARNHLNKSLHDLTGGRKFEVYMPHTSRIFYQEIANHPDCTAYSFLEEGFTSMSWEARCNDRAASSKSIRNHLRKLWVQPNYDFNRSMFDHSNPRYRKACAISENAFHGMPGRNDVSAHIPPLPLANQARKTYLILDASYLHHGILWQDYENALVAAVLQGVSKPGDLYVKFHFAETKSSIRFQSIRQNLVNHGFNNLKLLESDVSVEACLTRDDLLVFALSSLGYYANLMGVEIKCFAGKIAGVSLQAWIKDGRLPPDFLKVAGLVSD